VTDRELDETYTALCRSIAEVGEDKAPLLLATLSLALLARLEGADVALGMIEQARQITTT
jgi:hypothetical protein